MKKLPFYIALGVAAAAISALIIVEIRRRNQPLTTSNIPQGDDYLFDENSYAATTFKGFNLNLPLNTNTKKGAAEVTALQHMINSYFGGTRSVPVTGKFDSVTRAAVKDITDKSTTSLFEFLYHYLIPQRGEKVGTDLLISLTQSNQQ